jgi:hypothetical protein
LWTVPDGRQAGSGLEGAWRQPCQNHDHAPQDTMIDSVL